MKIRAGFVSNSSSSSFVVIMKKTTYDDMVKEMDAFEKLVVKELTPKKIKIFDTEAMSLEWWTGNRDTFEDMDFSKMEVALRDINNIGVDDEIDDDIYDRIDVVQNEIMKLARKNGGYVVETYG